MNLWQWAWVWVWLVGLGAIETGGKWSWEKWEGGKLGGKGSMSLQGLGGQALAFLLALHTSFPSTPPRVGLLVESSDDL